MPAFSPLFTICGEVLCYFRRKTENKRSMILIEQSSSCECPCTVSLHPSPASLCVFALNHLPSIHIETKLFTETGLVFSDSLCKTWEIESSETSTMTGMKTILNWSLWCVEITAHSHDL
ncbi:hypothetical protein GOODEAATRI_011725 [Goodea atripinnis]|uniref:Uncharacterized protein n=1 Tax=Goodea atripinnis TaxID=208336 RepID=A0ABV0NVK0_9TELE